VYLARDGVCLPGGQVVPPPRYYDELLLKLDVDLAESKEFERYERAAKYLEDCSPSRLAAREACALANYNRKQVKL
jgi:hypothetical protein